MIKLCRKCGVETERQANGTCKPCQKVRNELYYKSNIDKIKLSNAAWKAAHPDVVKKSTDIYNTDNRIKIRAAVAAWYLNNPEYRKEYLAANRDAKYTHNRNYRAKKLSSGGKLSDGLSDKLFKLQHGLCPCCNQSLGDDYHMDHKMPLALNGANEDWNMQLLRKTCNLQKHAKHPIDFMQSKGFLL